MQRTLCKPLCRESSASYLHTYADFGYASALHPRSLLLRNRDFRLLWTGSTTGKYGASVTSVALPLVAVTLLHASTLQVGLLTAATWLPWLLIGLPAGAWVDRLPRRPVMLTADAAALLLFAGIPVAAWTGLLSIGYLLATAVLAGTATVFFQTAYTALLPHLVASADQAEGNSKLHGSESAAQLAGFGSGGFLVQAVGAANGLFVNAATFAVSFLCVLRIKHREPRGPEVTRSRGALGREIRTGLRLTFGDPYLRAMAVTGGASNLALMAYQSILVVFLVREVHLASGTIGALMTAGGIGGIVGAFAARRVAARIGSARALIFFQLAVPSLALLIPLTTPGFGLVLFVIGYTSVSIGVIAANIIASTFRQQYCPKDMLGRISASAAFLNYGTIPLGAVLGGALGEALGTRTALWITIAGLPVAASLLWFSPIRRTRDLPTGPPATTRPPAGGGARALKRAAGPAHRRLQRWRVQRWSLQRRASASTLSPNIRTPRGRWTDGMCAMPSTTWTEARTRKPVACRTGRGEPPPGFHASTAARTYSIDAPYITRAPTLCSVSP